MFWAARTLKCAAKAIVTGSATALAATTVSCGMAIVIEGAANRLLYGLFPHWYRDVEYAYGLPELQYDRYHGRYHADGIMASEAMAATEEHVDEMEGPADDTDSWREGGFAIDDAAVAASRALGLLPVGFQKQRPRSITGEVFSVALTG